VLEMTNPGTATTITWPSSLDWPAKTEPTWTTTGVDVITIHTRDGGVTWLATNINLDVG
jgi:hypothetical protein